MPPEGAQGRKGLHLTEQERAEICRLRGAGLGPKEIAPMFGVRHETVYHVWRKHGVVLAPNFLFKKKLTRREEEALVHDYCVLEMSGVELEKKWGISDSLVFNIIRRHGMSPRRGGPPLTLTPDLAAKILDGVRAGKCITTAAKDAGKHPTQVAHWAQRGREEGVGVYFEFACALASAVRDRGEAPEVRQEGRGRRVYRKGKMVSMYELNEDYFGYITTEAQAYWLGFCAADCGITDRGRRFTLALKVADADHIERFRAAVGSNAPVRLHVRPGHWTKGKWVREREIASLQIRSPKMLSDLARYGVVERKTETVPPWDGPPHLLRHFYRGLVDGDGTLGIYIYRGRKIGVLGLSGNLQTLEAFAAFVRASVNYPTRVRPRSEDGCWRIAFTGTNLPKEVAALLYEGATVFLPRKQELACRIIVMPVLRQP